MEIETSGSGWLSMDAESTLMSTPADTRGTAR